MKANRPPTLEGVRLFARANRKSQQLASEFFTHYEARKWLTGSRKPLANWKEKEQLARWIASAEKDLRRTGY